MAVDALGEDHLFRRSFRHDCGELRLGEPLSWRSRFAHNAQHYIHFCRLAVADLDLRSRLAATLGDASYGIYLLHFPAIIVAARVLQLHGLVWFFFYLAIGATAGYAFGLLDCRIYRRLVSSSPWLGRATMQVPLDVASETMPSVRDRRKGRVEHIPPS